MRGRNLKRWYVVADAGRAIAYSRRGDGAAYDRIATWTSELALPSNRQPTATDRPGRIFDSTGDHRHAAESAAPKEQVKQAFGRGLAQALNRARAEGLFKSLVLFASPRFLHELRTHLDKPTAGTISHNQPKDLTRLPEQELFDVFDSVDMRAPRRTTRRHTGLPGT
jgi:protein required for attachment to host cells